MRRKGGCRSLLRDDRIGAHAGRITQPICLPEFLLKFPGGYRLEFMKVAHGHERDFVRRHQDPRTPYGTCNLTGGGNISHLVNAGQAGCVISDFIFGWQVCTSGHVSQTEET